MCYLLYIIIIDNSLSMKEQIKSVVKICRFYICDLWIIRRYLSKEIAKTIVHSTIISRIDYCNSLYINLRKTTIESLQKVMNEAARLITLVPRRDHITQY